MNKMPILDALKRLRDDFKEWCRNNFATKEDLENYLHGNK